MAEKIKAYESGRTEYCDHVSAVLLKIKWIRKKNFFFRAVEWSLHNPNQNVYDFYGIANLDQFIKLAAQEDLFVILRIGPYISADRDFGGLPHWLLSAHSEISLRTSELSKILPHKNLQKFNFVRFQIFKQKFPTGSKFWCLEFKSISMEMEAK